jgi:hypothetical protein
MSERALHSIHSAKNISIFLTYSGKWKSAQKTHKTQGRCGASYKFADGGSHMGRLESHVKQEEDILSTGQIVSPNGAKTPYIGNREMSDESRNRL